MLALSTVPLAAGVVDCAGTLETGRQLYNARHYSEAVQIFETAFQTCEQKVPALLALAKARLYAEDLPGSLKTLDSLLAIDPSNVAAIKVQSDAFYLSGKDGEAESSLLRALKIDPANEDLIYSLGRIYYSQHRYDIAIHQFQRVIELNPNSYRGYDNLGLCHEASGDENQAIRDYLKAIDLVYKDHPDYDWAYGDLANLFLRTGKYRKAFDLASEAATRNPASARNFYLTGKALWKLDKADLSVRWLTHAVDLDPQYPEAHYLLSQVYKKLGREQDAHQELSIFEIARKAVPQQRR